MKAKTMSVLIVASLITLLVIGLAMARPDTERVPANKGSVGVTIPAHAVEIASNVFSLGFSSDVDGSVVEGLMFIHKRTNNAKPPWAGGGKSKGGDTTCYEFIVKGAKWKDYEPWVMNPSNELGLDENSLFTNVTNSIQKWEDAAGSDIIGVGSTTYDVLVADESSPDNKNEVYFGSIANSNTIAVTIVWGVFRGPPSGRRLVEWDQIYNTNYAWNLTGEPGKMDFENIATHELGHTFGLSHPPAECVEETMYAYADLGETIKRSLNAGDIAGVLDLYS